MRRIAVRNKKVLFLIVLLPFLFADHARAATLFLSAQNSYTIGQTFSVPIYVSTLPGQSLNAISASLSFPADKIEVVSASKANSILNFWTQEPAFSNTNGSATFEGIAYNPGFTGKNGLVASISFKVKSAGTAKISFGSASVLANDGQGTNILESTNPITLSLGDAVPDATTPGNNDDTSDGSPLAPKISSDTHSDPNSWYAKSDPVFSWKTPDDITAVRISYTASPSSAPTVIYEPAISSKKLEKIADGVYYLHVQFKNKNGWGAISHFRFQIDTVPPEPFQVSFVSPDSADNPRPAISFTTSDKLSGISYYSIKIGDADFIKVLSEEIKSGSYTPLVQGPGKKAVIVVAYDKAGNSTTESSEFTVQAIKTPTIGQYQKELENGDILKIQGTSYPDSTVTVYLKDEHGVITNNSTKTSSASTFDLTWDKKLSPGVYTFTAHVTDARGAQSFPTEAYTIEVKEKAFLKIGNLIINYFSITFVFLALLAGIIILILYLAHKVRVYHKKLKGKIDDVEDTIHEDFEKIAENVREHFSLLQGAKKTRTLTSEETIIFKSLKKQLASFEKDIDAKLEKIKKEIK